jgi:hypothetical protein
VNFFGFLLRAAFALKGGGQTFELMMISRSRFCGAQNFLSIVIVAPPSIPKMCPVLKQPTGWLQTSQIVQKPIGM